MNWVDWGDAPAWLALATAGVAAFYAARARGDSKRSADAAEQSALDGRRAADAAVRSAQAEEAALQLQQAAA